MMAQVLEGDGKLTLEEFINAASETSTRPTPMAMVC
jgi:hypothetical protein